MTREDLKDDLSRLIFEDVVEFAKSLQEMRPLTEARISNLCSRPSRKTAERIVQHFENLLRKEDAHGQA